MDPSWDMDLPKTFGLPSFLIYVVNCHVGVSSFKDKHIRSYQIAFMSINID